MYIDFKPSQIIKILDSGDFFEFTAILHPESFENKEMEEGGTFISQKNVVLDYTSQKVDTPIFLRCCLHKEFKVSVMDFKNYKISALREENPYISQDENVRPVRLKASEVIKNIIEGYPVRIKGYIIRNVSVKPEGKIDLEIPFITVDINCVDFFKKDARIEGLSHEELVDVFIKKQKGILSENEIKEFKNLISKV